MATGLAELAVKLGLDASVMSCRVHDTGVHTEWDGKVLSGKRSDIKEWFYKCSHVVWFGVYKEHLAAAKRFRCKNILVLDPTLVDDSCQYALNEFDTIICPSLVVKASLSERWNTTDIHSVPWDPGGPLLSKDDRTSNNRIGVYVPIQGGAAVAYGPKICYSLQILLDENPSMHITISHTKRWTRESAKAISELLSKHGSRVDVIKNPAYHQRMAAYASNDWTLYLHRRDGLGTIPLESLCNGTPVVTPYTEPLAEIVSSGYSGILFPCDVSFDGLGLPILVDPTPKQLLEGMKPLADPTNLHRLREQQWPELEDRRRSFQVSWRFAWGDLAAK